MAKEPKAPKAPKPAKPGKPGKVQGNGLLTVWTVTHGVIFGGLWWMGWLAVQRAPGEDVMHVVGPYAGVAAAVFFLLMVNISDAMARGAQQQA